MIYRPLRGAPTHRALAMKILGSLAIFIGVTGAGFYLFSSALTDMTAHDCYVNKVQRACEALK